MGRWIGVRRRGRKRGRANCCRRGQKFKVFSFFLIFKMLVGGWAMMCRRMVE